jgi:Uma2 family endonuclease
MGALTHPALTPTEFATLMDRAGWRAPIELIEGEVVAIPPLGGHASLAETRITHRLCAWQEAGRHGGRVLGSVFVRIGDSYLGPDVAWWAADRQPAIGDGAIETRPDLVIEVLSPRTRGNDLGPKRQAYVRAGVKELWLVDPAERTVTVVENTRERVLRPGETLTSALLPGFGMAVAGLFVEP